MHSDKKKQVNKINKILHIFSNYIIFTFLFFTLTANLTGCANRKSTIPLKSKSFLAFDTVVHISIYDNTTGTAIDSKKIDTVLSDVKSKCEYYDDLFNKSKPNSDIYKINHSPEPVTVSDETLFLIKESIKYSELTDGAIDITVAKVKNLWDFTSKDASSDSISIPTQKDIDESLRHVNFHNIVLSESSHTVYLSDPKSEIDLGFIAKGYIADQIKNILISDGIENAIINLGGNVYCIGQKPNGSAFTVGIEKPFDKLTYIEKVTLKNKSVVTSGIYERYLTYNDQIYHHIINPETGYPASTDLLSASIISDSSMEADALSTTCILLGSEKAIKLLDSLSVDYILITSDYKIIKTQNN